MQITIIDKGRQFSALVDFLIKDSLDGLIALSIGGLESSISAITAGFIEGRNGLLEAENYYDEISSYRNYRRLVRKADGFTYHGMLLHKSAVFGEDNEYHTVIAEDGDVEKAAGTFFAKKFALPMEWVNQYYHLIPSEMMEELTVLTNPNLPKNSIRAVKFSSSIDEQFFHDLLDKKLKSGELTIPRNNLLSKTGKFDPSWSTREYLTANAEILALQLEQLNPRFDPKTDTLDKEIALMKRIPFPVQAHLIQGIVNTFMAKDGENAVFCGGDMGTGKSITSLGVAHLMHKKSGKKGYKVLLVAPGITIPKWVDKEIKETLPWAKTRVLRSHEDAIALLNEAKNGYEPEGIEFVLVSTDRAKLGPEPWCSAIYKRVTGYKYYAWHCPDCGATLENNIKKDGNDEEQEDETIIADWNALAYGEPPTKEDMLEPKNKNGIPLSFIPSDKPFPWNKRSQIKKCQACETKLWRPALKDRGEARNRPRWFVSRILKELGPWFDLMIQDEVHQTKAQDSGRGDAFAQMVKASKKVLMLTGTLVNGKSTSIKEILWRTNPKTLLDDGFDHKSGMVAWASRYGVLKRVIVETETDTGVSVRKKRTELQPSEEPGIAPQMTAKHLLDKTVFMELGDLGLPLVEKKEIPVFLDMDEEHNEEYRKFHESLYDKCKSLSQIGFKGAWSKFIPSTINYADRPDLGGYAELFDEVIEAPSFGEDYFTSKERWLVELIKQELSEGRGVLIYNKYTDGYKMNDRVQFVLKEHGINSAILSSNTSTERRVEWLMEQEEKGQKVIITNMRLVEVGLDCLAWPTIVNYQMDYDINIFRQSNGRNWRIGQHRECRLYTPILNNTQQVAQFENLTTKRAHALLVEGRLDRSELRHYGKDAHNTMASDLASCIAKANLGNQWQSLAAKDLDENLKIVSEKEFKSVVSNTMTALQEETMNLCGVSKEERDKLFLNKPVEIINPILTLSLKQQDIFSIELDIIETVTKGKQVQMGFNW